MKLTIFLFAQLIGIYSFSQSFYPQTSGVTTQLNGINFATPSSGIVVGNSGVIRKTSNSGLNWTSSSSGTTADLLDVAAFGPTSYFTVGKGGTMLRTTNSGTSWTTVVNAGTSNNLNSIYVSGQNIYVTGDNGTVLKSVNSGGAWSTLNTGVSLNLKGAYFVSDNIGYVVGDAGTILKTVNGGVVWTVLNSGAANYSLTSISFPDGVNGVITGGNSASNQSVILTTTNQGTNWASQSFPNTYLNKLCFIDMAQGYAVGGSVSANSSEIQKSTNSGISWNVQNSNSSRQLGVCTPSFDIAYTCGLNGTILRYGSSVAGVNESEQFNSALIYPNPSSGIFNLEFDQNVNDDFSLNVYSIDGRFLFQQDKCAAIDLSNFPSGLYYLVVRKENEITKYRLIKE